MKPDISEIIKGLSNNTSETGIKGQSKSGNSLTVILLTLCLH